MAALAKDPAQRWQTAEDFAAGAASRARPASAGRTGGAQRHGGFAPVPSAPCRRRTAAARPPRP